MDNFVNNFSEKSRNWAYGALVAVLCLLCMTFLCEFIDMLARGYASFLNVFTFLLSSAVHIGVALFGVLMYKRKNTVAFKTFFVLYFGYIFVYRLFSVFSYLNYFNIGSTYYVFYAIFMLVSYLLVAIIGILVTIDAINGTDKYVKIVRYLVLAYLIIIFAQFVLYLVGTCTRNCLWTVMLKPSVDFATALAFFGLYNKKYGNEQPKKTVNELKFDNGED